MVGCLDVQMRTSPTSCVTGDRSELQVMSPRLPQRGRVLAKAAPVPRPHVRTTMGQTPCCCGDLSKTTQAA